MQREVSQSSPQLSQVPFEPLMLSITERTDTDAKIEKIDTVDNPRTWSDQMREIDQLEDPERWDGLS